MSRARLVLTVLLAAALGALSASVLPAWAGEAPAFTQCAFIKGGFHPELGPKGTGKAMTGIEPIPAGWTVINGTYPGGTTMSPLVLICR